MMKSIAALAALASASVAQAMIAPPRAPSDTTRVNPAFETRKDVRPQPDTFKSCISVSADDKGVMTAGNCDESRENQMYGRDLLSNGCAEGQASFTSRKVKLPLCTHFTQL